MRNHVIYIFVCEWVRDTFSGNCACEQEWHEFHAVPVSSMFCLNCVDFWVEGKPKQLINLLTRCRRWVCVVFGWGGFNAEASPTWHLEFGSVILCFYSWTCVCVCARAHLLYIHIEWVWALTHVCVCIQIFPVWLVCLRCPCCRWQSRCSRTGLCSLSQSVCKHSSWEHKRAIVVGNNRKGN